MERLPKAEGRAPGKRFEEEPLAAQITTRGPNLRKVLEHRAALRPWGEGWGLQKGIWLIRSAKVARHTNPALGLSNRRYLRGMIPSESKTGTRLWAHRD